MDRHVPDPRRGDEGARESCLPARAAVVTADEGSLDYRTTDLVPGELNLQSQSERDNLAPAAGLNP